MIAISAALLAPALLIADAGPAPELRTSDVRVAQASVRAGVRRSKRHWEREVQGRHGGPRKSTTAAQPGLAVAQQKVTAAPKRMTALTPKAARKPVKEEPKSFWAWLLGW